MKRILLFTGAASALLAAPAARAQDLAAQDAFDLDEIVISGGFVPVPASAFGRSATVLTADDIARQNERYVADVLRTVPGLNVSRTGSFGALTQVRIRGHEGNHTLVLIDGVEVANTNQGEYDFGGMLTADIDRIEVLRGPQSALYGSNAIGGVISITTRGATEPGFSGDATFDLGTDETVGGSLALRQRFERGDASLSIAGRDTGGFDLSGEDGEDDGARNTTINLRGSYELADGIRIGGTLRSVDRTSEYDQFNFGAADRDGLITDAEGNFDEVEERYGALFLEADAIGGRLENTLTLTFAEIDRDSFTDDVKSADTTGTRRQARYVGSFALDADTVDAATQVLTFAAEYEEETYKENDRDIVFAPGQLEERTRSQRAYVLEYQGSYDFGLDVQGSIRFDDNDDFEDATTWALGLSYTLPNGATRLHASAGTGVQNPTLVEQFGFFSDFQGNPDLEPEQSRGFDLGVEQTFANGAGVIDVTYFDEVLTDEIFSTRDPETGFTIPVNQEGESTRRGWEVTGSYVFSDALSASLAYTFLDATDPDGGVEVRRPEHELYLQATYALPNDRTSFTLGIQHVAGLSDLDFTSPSFGADRVQLDDYTLVDLAFRHDVSEQIALTGAITNLTDADYEELYGYETPGRTVFLGLSATF